MRSTRALFAGAALAAALSLAGPAVAHADGGAPDGRGSYAEERDPAGGGYDSDEGWEDHGRDEGPAKGREGGWDGPAKGRDGWHGPPRGHDGRWGGPPHGRGGWHGPAKGRDGWHGPGGRDDRPRGGVHTGGGGMATRQGGMAAGGVLLLGGVGAGAYVMRRRASRNAA